MVTIIVSIFMYDDDYNWRANCCHYKIKEIDLGNRWLVLEVWVIVGWLRGLLLIVIWFVLMLYDLCDIIEKDRGGVLVV